MSRYAHTCEDGHDWIEQEDGGVSPSWGHGLTSVKWPGRSARECPEPERDEDGQITCAGCGRRFYLGHGTPGVMSDPWNYEERCQPATPVCGKPPVRTAVWVEGSGRGKARTFGGWQEISTDALTNATGDALIASVGNPDEPEEVPMTETDESFTINKLTPLNVRAIRETLGAKGVRVVTTATTATFEQMTRPQARALVESAIATSTGRGHPRASLHAVLRKLRDDAPTQQEIGRCPHGALIGFCTHEDCQGVVTLVGKTDGKGAWHFRNADEKTVTGQCGIRLQEDTTHGITVHVVDGVDERVQAHAGRPVCVNCIELHHRRNPAAPMTEEVNMSTAASASSEAKTDFKPDANASGQRRQTRSTGRSTSRTAAASAPKQDDGPTIEAGLDKALLAEIKKGLPKPELKSPASGSYTIVKSNGVKVGALHPQSRKGVMVLLALSPTAVKAHVKGATVEKFEKNVIRSRLYVTTQEQIAGVVAAAKEAAKAAK